MRRTKAKIKIEDKDTLDVLFLITQVALKESTTTEKFDVQATAMRLICTDVMDKLEDKLYIVSTKYTLVLKDFQALVWLETLRLVRSHKALTQHGIMVVQRTINQIERYLLSISDMLQPQKALTQLN